MDIETLQKQIATLTRQVEDLQGQVYKNNFPSHQDFNKTCYFNSRLKIPVLTTLPTTSEVGEVCQVSGIMYICLSSGTWQVVGLQS